MLTTARANFNARRFALVLFSLLFFYCDIDARAQTVEVRALGPAMSYHFSENGAQKKTEITSERCRLGTYVPPDMTSANGLALGIPDKVCNPAADYSHLDCSDVEWVGSAPISVIDPLGRRIYIPQRTGVCKAYKETTSAHWHGNNPGLGLEWTWRGDGYANKAFGTFVRDSYGAPGFMAGVARMYPITSAWGFNLEAGPVAGLWYRTALDTKSNDLHRVLMPFILPSFSITEDRTGLGINGAIIPKMKVNGRYLSSTWTIMTQLTYLVYRKENGAKQQIGFELTPGGGKVTFGMQY